MAFLQLWVHFFTLLTILKCLYLKPSSSVGYSLSWQGRSVIRVWGHIASKVRKQKEMHISAQHDPAFSLS